MKSDELLTVKEAADRMRRSEHRVRQLIADGTLPSAQIVKPRGRHLIRSRDIARLLEPGQ